MSAFEVAGKGNSEFSLLFLEGVPTTLPRSITMPQEAHCASMTLSSFSMVMTGLGEGIRCRDWRSESHLRLSDRSAQLEATRGQDGWRRHGSRPGQSGIQKVNRLKLHAG